MNKYKIPTYSPSKGWHYTKFEGREQFRDFVKGIFREPGLYNFDDLSLEFNKHARTFQKRKQFCDAPELSRDYIEFWDSEKEKCRKGVIFDNDNGGVWYLPRFYYHWLNFLQIYDKRPDVKKFIFAEVRDVQYHMALYEILAELHDKNSAILKSRQKASSYFHVAKLYNRYLFEEGYVGKIGASDKKYINKTKGSWKFLNQYHNFTNKETAWSCTNMPDKEFEWEQKVEQKTADGRKIQVGTMATITGVSFDKDPVSAVGGACMAAGTPIIISDGTTKNIEDISSGEYVIGLDGLPKLIGKLFRGTAMMYKVEQSQGMSYIVNGNHLIYTWNTESKKPFICKAEEFNNFSTNKKKVCRGIKFRGLIGGEKILPMDPYYLGLYLGDGDKYGYRILINYTRDPEIMDYMQELVKNYPDYEVKSVYKNTYRPDYNDDMYNVRIVNKVKGRNYSVFQTVFKQLGLRDKRIPEIYFTASQEQRLQLLAALIDTDGYYAKTRNRYELTVKKPDFAQDVVRLCTQLGFNTRIYKVTHKGLTSTVYNKPTTSFRIAIAGKITTVPCKVNRKKATQESQETIDNYSSLKVTEVGIGEYYGFECEDHLYVLKDGTITHNTDEFFYEEGGIAPTADITYGYIMEAMREGAITTGMFSIAGSVGALDQCEPLKKFVMDPIGNDFYPVWSNLLDENGTEAWTGLFIPEQWGMIPYIDQYGNSMVTEALQYLNTEYENIRKNKSAEDYQLRISQRPRNIKEALAIRTVSIFPVKHTTRQVKRIEDKELYLKYVDLERNDENVIVAKTSEREPNPYPIKKTEVDKRGCVVIHEHPGKTPDWGRYYFSVDPVEVGGSATSDSLAAVYIYKNPMEVTRIDEHGNSETFIEGDKIVAEWVGRFDDPNETNEYISLLVEYYNAWGISENNKTTFNNYMIAKKRTRHLAPSNEMLFDKELGLSQNVSQKFGWTKSGSNDTGIWKKLLQYGVDYLSEELGEQTDDITGKVIKVRYGVERIPFIWLLREMQNYQPKGNFDRLISYCALIAFAKIQQAAQGIKKRTERAQPVDKAKVRTFDRSSFLKSIGKPVTSMGIKRGLIYKSIR